LAANPEEKIPMGRPKSRWGDKMKMDYREIGWGVDWIHLAQDINQWRDTVNTVMKP
jgi:hypothetical protein